MTKERKFAKKKKSLFSNSNFQFLQFDLCKCLRHKKILVRGEKSITFKIMYFLR